MAKTSRRKNEKQRLKYADKWYDFNLHSAQFGESVKCDLSKLPKLERERSPCMKFDSKRDDCGDGTSRKDGDSASVVNVKPNDVNVRSSPDLLDDRAMCHHTQEEEKTRKFIAPPYSVYE